MYLKPIIIYSVKVLKVPIKIYTKKTMGEKNCNPIYSTMYSTIAF